MSIPQLVALALQADGWYLRQDIIWCLSGGTWLYARTQKGDMPIMVRDLARLKPGTVELWNGEKWTPLLGMNKSKRRGDELEIVLRSGERISCTPTHRWPTHRGLLNANELQVGDILTACRLPEPEIVKDCAIDEDAAWFAGLFIAEGSRSDDTIQIAGHAKETERWERVQRVATKFGGTATRTIDGNNMSIRIYGKVLNAIIDELTTGRTAKNKGFAPVVWRYSNQFIAAMVDGYLSGDGNIDGNRWRLGFTRNYSLERDLRTACARLGYTLTLNIASVEYDGNQVPTFRGELRKERSGHHNERDRNEIVEIRKARCREVYDLGVADEPHLFALASGVLTHNSKPNPMPESVRDRCTKAHEYIFLLSKSARYYYDAEAVSEKAGGGGRFNGSPSYADGDRNDAGRRDKAEAITRNRRSVWTITTKPYSGAHFAVMPPDLVEPCILAGTSERGCCPKCGKPWERNVGRPCHQCGSHIATQGKSCPECGAVNDWKRGRSTSDTYATTDWNTPGKGTPRKLTETGKQATVGSSQTVSIGWRPGCECYPRAGEAPECFEPAIVPCTVLDPFAESGTTLVVAAELGRNGIGIELNPEYVKLAQQRIDKMRAKAPLFDAAMQTVVTR